MFLIAFPEAMSLSYSCKIFGKRKQSAIDELLLYGNNPCFKGLIHSVFRFNDHWRMTMQRLSFLGSFELYLEHERLATRQEIAELLGGLFYLQDCNMHFSSPPISVPDRTDIDVLSNNYYYYLLMEM